MRAYRDDRTFPQFCRRYLPIFPRLQAAPPILLVQQMEGRHRRLVAPLLQPRTRVRVPLVQAQVRRPHLEVLRESQHYLLIIVAHPM
jgi:hypothetical protein